MDLYRLPNASEPTALYMLGLPDGLLDATCLIEWPDRHVQLFPKSNLDVIIRTPDGAKRLINIDASIIDREQLWADVLLALI